MTKPGPAAFRLFPINGIGSIAVLLAALVLSVGAVLAEVAVPLQPLTIEAQNGTHEFSVEIADTESARAKGLMYRRSLAADRGMLFLYERAEPIGMWMRNTYISLDMLFLDADGKIVQIERNTEPFSEKVIDSDGAVSAVLELNAGTADRLGIKTGDRVCHDSFEPPC